MRFFQCLSVPKTWLSSLCLVVSLFCSQGASANNWEITYFGQQSASGQFVASPTAHCSSINSMQASGITDGRTYKDANFVGFLDNQGHITTDPAKYASASCTFTHPWYGSPWRALYTLRQQCSAPSTLNPQTGECVAPPNVCEATIGQVVTHEHKMKAAVGDPVIEPPGSVCANSCQYAFGYTAATNVYVYSTGDPSGVFGVYSYTGNGIQCTGDTRKEPGSPGAGDKTDPNETPTPDENKQCPTGYVWNGTFCSKEPPKPCDPAVEVGGCPTDPTDPTDPKEPGDGDTGGGSGGGGSGGGDGSGSGDGPGDGSGDGSGSGDGEEKPPVSSVSGEGCKVSLACTGDAIQCAVLRQQKALKCSQEEFQDMSAQKVTDMRTTLDGEFSKTEYQPLQATAATTFDLSSMIDTSSRFGRSCPVVSDWSWSWIGGGTINVPIGTLIGQLCDYLRWFGYFVVAFAMRRAAEIIALGMN